jgi:hypothetical protein
MSNENSNFLISLAADIAGLRSRANQANLEGLKANKDIGEKLSEGEEVLKKERRFLAWAIEQTGFSKSWIFTLKKLYKKWPEIEPQLSTAVDFSVKGALALLRSSRLNQAEYSRAKELLDAWNASDEPPEGEAYGKFKNFADEKRMDADMLRQKVEEWAHNPSRQREPLKAQVARLTADNARLRARLAEHGIAE